MPPRQHSRFTFSEGRYDEDGRLYLTEPEPYGYRDLPDNIEHVVREGDTLWTLAATYFGGRFPRPAGLWWILADFQPEPIHDPTLALVSGSVLIIPSPETVRTRIFSERRRRDAR